MRKRPIARASAEITVNKRKQALNECTCFDTALHLLNTQIRFLYSPPDHFLSSFVSQLLITGSFQVEKFSIFQVIISNRFQNNTHNIWCGLDAFNKVSDLLCSTRNISFLFDSIEIVLKIEIINIPKKSSHQNIVIYMMIYWSNRYQNWWCFIFFSRSLFQANKPIQWKF